MTLLVHLADADATAALGARIGKAVRGGDVVALCGAYGAGKTTLAKAIGRALGTSEMSSPSFALVHEHPLPSGDRLMHVDAWRCSGPDALTELGWAEWSGADDVLVCVEWADRIEDALKSLDPLVVQVYHAEDGRDAELSWGDAARLSSLMASGDVP